MIDEIAQRITDKAAVACLTESEPDLDATTMARIAVEAIVDHLGLSWEMVDALGRVSPMGQYLTAKRVSAAADSIATLLKAAGVEPQETGDG